MRQSIAHVLITLTIACWAYVPAMQLIDFAFEDEVVWNVIDGAEEDRNEENKGEEKGEADDEGKKWSSESMDRAQEMMFDEAWARADDRGNWDSPQLKGHLEPPECCV